jgi:hypothetical protein
MKLNEHKNKFCDTISEIVSIGFIIQGNKRLSLILSKPDNLWL